MSSKTKGIIATVASVIFCACPGLLACVWGAIGLSGQSIDTNVNGVTGSAPMPTALAIGLLCGAVILVLIPVVVGFLTLRPKPAPAVSSEPLPPAA